MSDQDYNENWAEQVPWERPRTPYREFGWEPGESVLPEFRDLSVDVMPYERARVSRWRKIEGFHELGYWVPGPHTGKGPKNYRRNDMRIYEDVNDRFTQAGHLDATDIRVEVTNGEVTLTGQVPDRRQKRMAQDIADSVSGVNDVHNQLVINQQASGRV